MAKVSVVLPTYNCARYLPESVDSVLAQTYKDIELLIVDDGSTDGTEEVAARYLPYPNVKYIKQDHAGLPVARNTGIDAANGDYLAFIDADDVILPEKVRRQAFALDSRPGVDITYTGWKYFYDGDKTALFPSSYAKLSGDLFLFLKRSNFIHISTVMLRRSVLGSLRFDQSLRSHEDWDFFIKLAYNGARFMCIKDPLSMVRVRKTSMTAEQPTMDSSRSVVGERAKRLWKELKSGISFNNKEGVRNLIRYLALKARARVLNFPDSPNFNKPIPKWR